MDNDSNDLPPRPRNRNSWHAARDRVSTALNGVRLSYLEGLSSFPESYQLEEDFSSVNENARSSLTALPRYEKSEHPDVEAVAAKTHQRDEADDNVVSWDGDDDPRNPQNWSSRKKWGQLFMVSWLSLLTPMAAAMLVPGMPQISRDFHITSGPLQTFAGPVQTLGFAVGSLFVAPLSEVYGRLPLYHISNIAFAVLTLVCSFSPTYGALILFRCFTGCLGSACLILGGSTIADIFPRNRRGHPGSVWSFGSMMGPSIAPAIGGEVVDSLGWKWIFYLLAITGGASTILAAIVLRETYGPIILQRKAKYLRTITGNQALYVKSGPRHIPFKIALIRPIRMLIFAPSISVISLVLAVLFGTLYLQITTIPFVFGPRYGFSARQTGLVYLAPGIGTVLALPFSGKLKDYLVRRADALGDRTPESARLSFINTLPSGVLLCVSLLLYGWAAEHDLPWPVPLIGLSLFNFALLFQIAGLQAYIFEQYPMYAASGTAAASVIRSLAIGLMPLSGLDMYYALGMGWANTLLAGLCAAATIMIVMLRLYGVKVRSYCRKQF